MTQRTQNPPPLKACRFDSDLGHHHRQRHSGLRRDHNPDWTDLYSERDESRIAARKLID